MGYWVTPIQKAVILIWICAAPAFLHGHEVPVRPVDVELALGARQARAAIEVHADYWLGVLLHTSEGSVEKWPAEILLKAERHLNSYLVLAIDGKRLKGKLKSCRYVHNPWQALTEASLVFDVVYPLPSAGEVLSVTCSFYFEELRELAASQLGDQDHGQFQTRLHISGGKRIARVLTPENPIFQAALSQVRPGRAQLARESFSRGFSLSFSEFSIPLFVFAAVLSPWSAGGLMGALLFALALTAFFFVPFRLPDYALSAASWACGMGMGLAAYLRLPFVGWSGILCLSAPVWAALAERALSESLPSPNLFSLPRVAFLTGFVASIAFFALASKVFWLKQMHKLRKRSESLAQIFFLSRLRFAASICAGLGLYFLFHSMGKG